MSRTFTLDRTKNFQNAFYKICINSIVDNTGPSIILRSILIVSLSGKVHFDFVLLRSSYYMLLLHP